jgi:hypothetical protein
MDLEMNEELDKKVGEATDNGRHGVKKTRQYLQYMLEYLEEFETEETKDV